MSSNLAGPVPARIGVRSLELRRAVTEGGSYRDPLEDAQLWSAAWAGAEVFVCENPTVLEAAADRHGDVRCHVRADGDVVGWRIVNQFRDRLPGALTWRMPEGCTAYEEELLENLLSDLGS